MKRLYYLLPLAAFYLLALTASASVTLELAGFDTSLTPKGNTLGNNAGVATAGMNWGIIVDTTGDGFLVQDEFFSVSTATSDQFTTFSNFANTDDFYFYGGTTQNLGAGAEAAISNLTLDLGSNGIDAGDSFALVWFNPDRMWLGYMTDASFTLPNDGFTEPYLDAMAGGIPVANIPLMPEPSTYAVILGAVVLGFVAIRKRNSK